MTRVLFFGGWERNSESGFMECVPKRNAESLWETTLKPNPESLGKTTTLTLITGWGNNPNRNHWMGKPKTDVQSLDISGLSI